MENLKQSTMVEFAKVARELSAQWGSPGDWFEIAKSGTVFRIRWSIERIDGVFVTLVGPDGKEYGLPYLVEFRGGSESDIAAATSDHPGATAGVFRRFAADLLNGASLDIAALDRLVAERVKAASNSAPEIKATRHVRPEWL